MKSIKLEYLRNDDLTTGILQKDRRYLKVEGNDNPISEVEMTIDHLNCIEKLAALNYRPDYSPELIQQTIEELSQHIQNIFLDFAHLPKEPTQIDLVLNPSELGLLPFEVLLRDDKKPWFAEYEFPIVLTRRIRHEGLIAQKENWPIVPRVLFAYANPSYGNFSLVPSNEHLKALKTHLQNWVKDETDLENNQGILYVLKNASLEDIQNKLLEADKRGKAFTHLHILAHGVLIQENPAIPEIFEYGIALNSDQGKPSKVAAIKTIFDDLTQKPFVVSYMVCDGGNFRNTLQSEKNLVQVTHRSGVPFVIGSQFPLTYLGSEIITDILYGGLFSGKDIRDTLHLLRCKLYENKDKTWNDWFGLVAYVRLPEGYEDYLSESTLALELMILKNNGVSTDQLLNQIEIPQNDLAQKAKTLETRVDNLIKLLTKNDQNHTKPGVYEENKGLIASAYKRIAELRFRENQLFSTNHNVREYLEKAKTIYKEAADFNLSHHWSLVQYISLRTILEGFPIDNYYWQAGFLAASNDENKAKQQVWALGSKAELFLLAPHLNPAEKKQKIAECFNTMAELIKKNGEDTFPLQSTSRQFTRYIKWWTVENGYHPIINALSVMELEELILILQ